MNPFLMKLGDKAMNWALGKVPGILDKFMTPGINPTAGLPHSQQASQSSGFSIPSMGGAMGGMFKPNNFGGLLSDDESSFAQNQGLLGAAGNLLSMSGPSTTPTSFGQALGAGLQGFQQGRQGALDNVMKGKHYAQSGRGEYYVPVQTAKGTFSFNSRTGKYHDPVTGQEVAAPVVAGNFDPNLQGAITEAKEKARAGVELATAGGIEKERAKAKSEVELVTKNTQKAIQAGNVTDLISQAEENLKHATGSYAGTAVAAGKRAVGVSDESTQANENLKLISGWMVSNVPRMEGPQSDFDVQNYKQMAARVGDSTVPIGDRKAALKTLLELQRRYTENAPSGTPVDSTKTQRRRYNPQTGKIE